MTDRALVEKWPIDRIDPTLRALFRAAGAEMKASDTPAKVIIAEYLSLSEAFYPCLLYTSPSPRDGLLSRMPSSA